MHTHTPQFIPLGLLRRLPSIRFEKPKVQLSSNDRKLRGANTDISQDAIVLLLGLRKILISRSFRYTTYIVDLTHQRDHIV